MDNVWVHHVCFSAFCRFGCFSFLLCGVLGSKKLFQGPLTWQIPIEYSLNTCGPVLLMCKQTNLGFKFVGVAWNLNFKTQNPNPQNPRSRIQTSKIQTPKSKLQKQKIKVQNPVQNQKIQIPNSKIKKTTSWWDDVSTYTKLFQRFMYMVYFCLLLYRREVTYLPHPQNYSTVIIPL